MIGHHSDRSRDPPSPLDLGLSGIGFRGRALIRGGEEGDGGGGAGGGANGGAQWRPGGRLMRVVVAELGVELGFEVVVEGEL
jgi:hypothetical protein